MTEPPQSMRFIAPGRGDPPSRQRELHLDGERDAQLW
jgi:hypothetical protein